MQLPLLPPKVLAILDALHIRVPLRTAVFGTIDFYRRMKIPFIRRTIKQLESRKAAEIRRTGRKIKVYFACIEKTQWGMQSIYDAMVDSDRFDPCVLVCEDWIRHGESDPKGDLARFFISKKMQVATSLDSNNLPDILFVPMFSWYNMGSGINYQKLYKNTLICCVLYSWATSNTDSYYLGNYEQVFLWKYFLFNDLQLQLSKQLSPIHGENSIATGFPRNDEFISAIPNYKFWKQKNTKKIIWAPHWSVLTHGRLGNFDRFALPMLNWLKTHPGIEILLKPHPLLRARMTDPETIARLRRNNPNFEDVDVLNTPALYDAYIKEWSSLPNGSVMDSGDYSALFASSDAMLLDSGSFTAEYMVFNKPICFCNRDRSPEQFQAFFNQLGREILLGMEIANTWTEVESFLSRIEEGIDLRHSQREGVTKKHLSTNIGHVGKTICDLIKEQLLEESR